MSTEKANLEEMILSIVAKSSDGLKPSEIRIDGVSQIEIKSACLDLAVTNRVVVGTDWRMRSLERKKHVCNDCNGTGRWYDASSHCSRDCGCDS